MTSLESLKAVGMTDTGLETLDKMFAHRALVPLHRPHTDDEVLVCSRV